MPQSPSEGILRSDPNPTEAYGVGPLGEIADAFVSIIYCNVMWEENLKKGWEVGD